eukprot:3559947-Prymnesium_polylepis.2
MAIQGGTPVEGSTGACAAPAEAPRSPRRNHRWRQSRAWTTPESAWAMPASVSQRCSLSSCWNLCTGRTKCPRAGNPHHPRRDAQWLSQSDACFPARPVSPCRARLGRRRRSSAGARWERTQPPRAGWRSRAREPLSTADAPGRNLPPKMRRGLRAEPTR